LAFIHTFSSASFGSMSTTKRKLVAAAALAVAAIWVAMPFIQAMCNRAIRFASGQHIMGGPLPGRSKENLPSVAVEAGNKLCCRMLYCDYRFPLPPGTRLASTEPVTGGFDTIKGALYVTNTDGGEVDLRAYARSMRRDGFKVEGDTSAFRASSPDGGFVTVEGSGSCRIAFSFFGDY
jgi:hypothetical protein